MRRNCSGRRGQADAEFFANLPMTSERSRRFRYRSFTLAVLKECGVTSGTRSPVYVAGYC